MYADIQWYFRVIYIYKQVYVSIIYTAKQHTIHIIIYILNTLPTDIHITSSYIYTVYSIHLSFCIMHTWYNISYITYKLYVISQYSSVDLGSYHLSLHPCPKNPSKTVLISGGTGGVIDTTGIRLLPVNSLPQWVIYKYSKRVMYYFIYSITYISM